MKSTYTIAPTSLNIKGISEALPENLALFLMPNSDQHHLHFGRLMFWSGAIFAVMLLWAMQIDQLKLLSWVQAM